MAKHFRDAGIDFPCPKCGYKSKQTIGRLEQNPVITCPSCRQRIKVEASQFRSEMTKVDRAIDDLRRTIQNFGKGR